MQRRRPHLRQTVTVVIGITWLLFSHELSLAQNNRRPSRGVLFRYLPQQRARASRGQMTVRRADLARSPIRDRYTIRRDLGYSRRSNPSLPSSPALPSLRSPGSSAIQRFPRIRTAVVSSYGAGPYDPDAWRLLAQGNFSEARVAFDDLTKARPYDGAPKTGQALASAFHGDHADAIVAMDHAIGIGGNSAQRVDINETLRAPIRDLITVYTRAAEPSIRRADALFMASALHFVLREYDEAMLLTRSAAEEGDTSAGVRRLAELLEAHAE